MNIMSCFYFLLPCPQRTSTFLNFSPYLLGFKFNIVIFPCSLFISSSFWLCLLKYSLHTVKIHLFKYTVWWVWQVYALMNHCHIPGNKPNRVHSRNIRLVQCSEINQYNSHFQQTKNKKVVWLFPLMWRKHLVKFSIKSW